MPRRGREPNKPGQTTAPTQTPARINSNCLNAAGCWHGRSRTEVQVVAVHQLSISHQLRSGTVGHHAAAVEDDGSRTQLQSKREIVGDHDLGGFETSQQSD